MLCVITDITNAHLSNVIKQRFSQSFINIEGMKKSKPLKFFAVFSATVFNFNLKFYRFIN